MALVYTDIGANIPSITGSNISNILWPIIANMIINPTNLPMNLKYKNGDEIESFFEWKVAQNFVYL